MDGGAWYAGWVDEASSAGLMTGYDKGPKAGLFGPGDALTRAQAATVLWRMAGSPAPSAGAGFPDVEAGSWYADAVDWCAANGIVTGYEDGPDKGRFVPDGEVTRAELAAMAWRWARWAGVDVSCPDPSAFESTTDWERVEDWAVEALTWTAAAGVLSGVDNPDGTRTLDPASGATRAQAAKVFTVLAGRPSAPRASHAVAFESNGGSAVAPQGVVCGKAASEPAAPTREGYAFKGWHSDKGLTQVYDFDTPVTSDVTLYARWAKVHTVAFESNGGTAVASQKVADGEAALEPRAPALEGHDFSGWYADKGLKQAYVFSAPVTSDLTLYAGWDLRTYTVAFDADGGAEVPSQPVAYGGTASEPDPAPARLGYEFAGWHADEGLTVPYDFSTPVTSDLTLYAKWDAAPCAVLHSDGLLSLQMGPEETQGHGGVSAVWEWDGSSRPWTDNAYHTSVTSVIAKDKIELSGDCTWMFFYLANCKSMELGKLDVSGVTAFGAMFSDCSSLESLDLTGWDVSSGADFEGMFAGCSSLAGLDGLSEWDVSKGANFTGMFYGCSKLASLNVSGWDVSKAQFITSMFYGCSELTSLNLSGWDVSNVTIFTDIFNGCSKLASLNVSGWDVSKSDFFNGMYRNCSSLTTLDLSGWNVEKWVNASGMISGCESLSTIILGEGCGKLAVWLGGPWYKDGVEHASITADLLPGTFTKQPAGQALALASLDAGAVPAAGKADIAGGADATGEAAGAGGDQPAGSGQPAGGDQSVSSNQPAGGDQSASSDQPAGSEQPADSDAVTPDKPANGSQPSDGGGTTSGDDAAAPEQPANSGQPAGGDGDLDSQPAEQPADEPTGSDGQPAGPGDAPAEPTADPEPAVPAGEESQDLAA